MKSVNAKRLFAAFGAFMSMSSPGITAGLEHMLPSNKSCWIVIEDTIPSPKKGEYTESMDTVPTYPPDSIRIDEDGSESELRSSDFLNGVINTPEQPEATAFVPTMMGDIEAASPTAGINIITPPSANNRGSATLQYPFIMPPARNGMSPTLGLTYDSDAGDGICGEGWSLPISSITVDTRWGVPRYSTTKETETYLLDGQMLSMQSGTSLYLAHRNPTINRNSSGTRRFHPRTGTDFSLIERSGFSPSTYTWKVTGPDGTEYTYGGGNATLKGTFTDTYGTTREVVSEWLLSRIEEPHGDYVSYEYEIANETISNNITSKSVYLKTVKAGNAEGTEHTVVTFYYKNRENYEMKTNSARYGFLTSCQQLVDSVIVKYRGTVLRSYGLRYIEGQFGHPLLEKVSHYDNNGNLASFQTFSYYDETNSNAGMVCSQNNSVTLNAYIDGLDESFILNQSDSTPSLLGSSTTQSKSVSIYAGFGVWNGSQWKDNTVGASYEYSDDRTKGIITLTDIDGDGLPDKVFRKSDGLWYRPMQVSSIGGMSLGSPIRLGTSVGSFSTIKSHTSSIGLRGVVGAFDITYQRGWDWHSTNSRTTEYMADVNGDGLPDLVSGGKVWFNHLETSGSTTIPTFSEGSHLSPNPIKYSIAPDISVINTPSQNELDSIADASPMQDVVRVWEAPENGMVNISGEVRLQDPPSGYDESEYEKADGVRVVIEKGYTTLWSQTIDRDDHRAYLPTGVSSISVTRGERIYFRLQCGGIKNSNGAFDRVIWSPTIQYTTGGTTSTPDGYTTGIYPCTQGVIANTGEMTSIGNATSIRLRGMMVKPITSDSVVFRAVATNNRIDSHGHPLSDFQTDTIFYKRFLYNETINQLVDTVISNNNQLPYIKLEMSSSSNVKWDEVKWIPFVKYTDNGGNEQKTVVIPYIDAYTQTFSVPASVGIGIQGATVTVTPSLSMPTTTNGKVRLVVKGLNRTWGTTEYDVVNGVIPGTPSNFVLTAPNTGPIWVEFYWPDSLSKSSSVSCSSTIRVNGTIISNSLKTGFYARRNGMSMGLMHRGWGGFIYNAAAGRHAQPINESLLCSPELQLNDTLHFEQLVLTPLSAKADTLGNLWGAGPCNDIYITNFYMGTARLGEQDVTWSNPLSSSYNSNIQGSGNFQGTGAPAPILVSSIKGKTNQNGVSILGPDYTFNNSSAVTKGDVTLQDMNGDGYPDIIAGGTIQYTNTLGGISGERISGMPKPESSASSSAAGIGGSPINAASTIVSVVSGSKASASGRLTSQLAKISISGNNANNYDESACDYIDINGDGLPDLLYDNNGTLTARLNLGYSFSQSMTLGTGHIQQGESLSSNKGIGAGDEIVFGSVIEGTDIHKASSSFSAGVGIASTISCEKESLVDINGDGLPDIVWNNTSGIWARLNMGSFFAADSVKWASGGSIGKSTTFGESENAAFTVTVNNPTTFMKFCVNPGSAIGKSVTKTRMAIRDIDGDGYPDLVSSDSESNIRIRCSNIRRTNMLKNVTNSLGGTFTLDYAHSTPTYGLPGGKWVMSSVEVDRGIHFTEYDIPVTRKTFSYCGGMRDRREREFLGFAEVVSTDLDTENSDLAYRNVTEVFDVSSYYRRGLLMSTTLRDASGSKFKETQNTFYTYSVRPNATKDTVNVLNTTLPSDAWPVAFSTVKFTQNSNYEGGAASVREQSAYKYNLAKCGEVSYYYHSGNGNMNSSTFAGYDYYANVTYSCAPKNNSTNQRRTISRPTQVVIKNNNGTMLSKTTATYQNGRNASKVATVTRTISESPSVTTSTTYSNHTNTGNLLSVSQNSESGTLTYSFQYNDDFLQTYPYRIISPHTLKTETDSMYLCYGLPKKQTDPNNKALRTIYDGLGRLISVKSPNENERYPSTIDMGYSPVAVMKADGTGISTPAYAVTTYHLRSPYTTPDDILPQNDDMRMVTFTDGFGRVLQTRREATIDYGNGQPNARVVVEGTTEYDGLDRPVMTHYPVLLPTTHLMIFQPAQLTEPGTSTSYDVADRPLAVTLPGNYTTQYGYSVNNGYLMTSVTDANGHQKDNFTDGSGKTVRTVMYRDAEATQPIETRYLYDPIGRLSTVINANGDSTIVTYDMLGRRTEVRHPASGKTRWTYDKLGNVLTEENKVLRRMGKKIEYTWDVDRIRRVVCNGDTVTYHYGSPSSDGNAAGRVDFRLDSSGGAQYEYDAMGNVRYERRTLAVAQKGNATFETEWVYDSYGKLLRMTYPGDEVVVYRYNETGGLKSVYGGKANQSTPYITHIGYDKFGVPFHRILANGRETSQRYDDTTRRLHFITFTYNGSLTGYRYYSYDAVGNVTSVFSTAPVNFRFDYGYDSLDRLVSATQRYGLNPSSVNNSLSMSYDDLWRITSKSQHLSQTNVMYPGTLNTGYSMNYNYDPSWGRHYRMKDVAETYYRTVGTPTDADNILSTHSYSYDPNGNLAYESVSRKRYDDSSTQRVSERKLLWDGMNHLRGISDNGYVSLFWYDADGNRTVKEHMGGEAVWVNGTAAGVNTNSVSYSIYPNPYISISGDRWTKHYYIGSERIASRTGTISNFSALNSMYNLPAGDGIMDSVVYSSLRHAQEDSIASMYAWFGVPYEVHRTSTRDESSHLYFPITRTGEDEDGDGSTGASDVNPQRNHPNTLGDGQVYYYLRDHLGSTLSVTDSVGNYAQQVEYTPWGEVFVEQQSTSSNFETPYLFNGKELDEETGLYYYGARYYDPKMSVWYSTDPMQEKYPSVTTYGYCINNPVKWYDLNGEDWYQDEDGTLQYNPDVHSQKNLKGSQMYKFSEWNDKRHGIHYRIDGSILYKNETAAYNRIWNQADIHYRKIGEKGGREVGGFILDNGSVLILPDYLNDSRTTKIADYGYIINGATLTKGSETFSILSEIHSHQDKSASPEPSTYMINGYGDLDISIAMGGKPVITIGHDGKLHAISGGRTNGKRGSVYKRTIDFPSSYNTRRDLLNGRAKLSQLLIFNQ